MKRSDQFVMLSDVSGPSSRIYAELKAQITSGVYAPGAALPSTRALALELGVARSTVTVVYERLLAEGYIETSPGRRAQVPLHLRRRGDSRIPKPPETGTRLSDFGKRLRTLEAYQRVPGLALDFRSGDLSGSDFPTAGWRRALNRALDEQSSVMKYDDAAGWRPLRRALAAFLWRSRGVRCDENQIIIVNGSQQGLDLCARLLLNTTDKVVVEEPGYLLAQHAFQALGATVVPVPVDQDGLQTALLAGVDARLAYVSP